MRSALKQRVLEYCSARFEHHVAREHFRRATFWSGLTSKLLGLPGRLFLLPWRDYDPKGL